MKKDATFSDVAPGSRVLIRGEEWLVKRVDKNTLGNYAYRCEGISPLVRGRDGLFLSDLDTIVPVDPARTKLVPDRSPMYRDTRLYVESALRRTVPTDGALHVGQHAAMDPLPFQLVPAYQALGHTRQRILIADTVGLGKTLEAGILMSELIARGKGRRILVVTEKSMLTQFQMEMWNRFTIPLVRLDSAKIQRIRAELPSNANPFFYYDKAIVSIDTIKRGVEYGVYLENAHWDIIVIDEAQNVAERGGKGRGSQRNLLAERLRNRSDSLIMLSATPHDGHARSFASLMNMLDPTAIADKDHYTPDDIKGLCVRRFKKDVRNQAAGTFLDRNVELVPTVASSEEERAFDFFEDLDLRMDRRRRGAGGHLFKIVLEKALFSSPTACIETVDNRLKGLSGRTDADSLHDALQLRSFRDALAGIGEEQFSRYQGLVALLRSHAYGWDAGNPRDRLVIFTERIETMRWVAQHLRSDFDLDDKTVRTMSGSMSDVEQQDLVTAFGNETDPVRILVASDVAAEGINLHYLCHRLVHFDTPWSLMIFQQRNGRIDRYGQQERPDIRFITTSAQNDRIRGDARIIQVLIEKEQRAHDNIGDPAMLLGKFDVSEETRVVEEAIEKGTDADTFASEFGDDEDDLGVDLLDMLISDSQENTPDQVKTAEDHTLLSDVEFLQEGIDAFGEAGGVLSSRPLDGEQGLRLKLDTSRDLARRLARIAPERAVGDGTVVLSPDRNFCMREAERARSAEFEVGNWPQAQYLWRLHPIFDWIEDRATMQLFKRDEAPIIRVDGMEASTAIFLVQGIYPNRKSEPVVDEWFGLLFENGRPVGELGRDEVFRLTDIGDPRIPNRLDLTDELASQTATLCGEAVRMAKAHMSKAFACYQVKTNPKIDEEVDKLESLRGRHKEALQLELPGMVARPSSRKVQQRLSAIDDLFDSYVDWVHNTLEIEDNPNIRIQAVFVGA